jgi:hypothetical protein
MEGKEERSDNREDEAGRSGEEGAEEEDSGREVR